MSNITSYNLVQDRIISVWDAQRLNLAIEGAYERMKQLAKVAVLASCASSSLKIHLSGEVHSIDQHCCDRACTIYSVRNFVGVQGPAPTDPLVSVWVLI